MNTTPSSIKVSGGKFCELTVTHKGMTMPVNVYIVQPKQGEPYSLCICFENTPIETQLAIDKNAKGEWVDMHEGASELARTIGAELDKKITQRLYN